MAVFDDGTRPNGIDARRALRGMPLVARSLGARRPAYLLAVAGIEAAIGVVLAVLMWPHSAAGALILLAFLLVSAGLLATMAVWSTRHRGEADRAVAARLDARDQQVSRHPLVFLLALPIAFGVIVGLRVRGGGHSVGSWVLAIAIGVAVAVVMAAAQYLSARRHSGGRSRLSRLDGR